ncbi:MAG: hypothetical protein IKT81_01330 [Clostridia bacterium]|nr:hypothetical protein [Clostridia bacterium]
MSRKISEIDKNLLQQTDLPEGITVHDIFKPPFRLYGFYKPLETGLLERGSRQIQADESINDGRMLLRNTAGGRVRFATNSKTVALCVKLPNRTVFSHMTQAAVCGFDMYAECDGANRHAKTFLPPADVTQLEYTNVFTFEEAKMRTLTINFPLYNDVTSLFIGLDEGADVEEASLYRNETPIVFYAGSITQGCSASRPGMCHTNILSRWLDSDILNLGLSGSDKGEPALARYIADLPMSAFVHGYGYNSPSIEYFEQTYYPFYKIIREKHPHIPILMVSCPVPITLKEGKRKDLLTRRREVTMNAYLKARREGDTNVWFVDGFAALGADGEEATIDGGHFTDLGYINMAKCLMPLLSRLLETEETV